jgi:hypothetical protein
MPDKPPRIYWDSCVFLSYINGHPDRVPTITQMLDDARSAVHEIVTSAVSQVEVAFGQHEQDSKQLDAQTEAKINALWQGPAVMVDLHPCDRREGSLAHARWDP